jgi:hypothetical protein
MEKNYYDFKVDDADGNQVLIRDMCKQAKVTMVVNVSFRDFKRNKNIEELVNLHS